MDEPMSLQRCGQCGVPHSSVQGEPAAGGVGLAQNQQRWAAPRRALCCAAGRAAHPGSGVGKRLSHRGGCTGRQGKGGHSLSTAAAKRSLLRALAGRGQGGVRQCGEESAAQLTLGLAVGACRRALRGANVDGNRGGSLGHSLRGRRQGQGSKEARGR